MLSTPNLLSLGGWYHLVVKGRMRPISDIYYAYSKLEKYRKLEKIGHMGVVPIDVGIRHVRLYTPAEVVDFLGRMGFEVELIMHRGLYYRSRYRWNRRLGNWFLRLFPRLRTSFSVVARKSSG